MLEWWCKSGYNIIIIFGFHQCATFSTDAHMRGKASLLSVRSLGAYTICNLVIILLKIIQQNHDYVQSWTYVIHLNFAFRICLLRVLIQNSHLRMMLVLKEMLENLLQLHFSCLYHDKPKELVTFIKTGLRSRCNQTFIHDRVPVPLYSA